MTVTYVIAPQGRLNADQRRVLAKTLTDAVLVPEVGKLAPEARRGDSHRACRQIRALADARDRTAIPEHSGTGRKDHEY